MKSAIPADFDPAIVGTIQHRLDSVERDGDVSLIVAVESGSRAWGFPSPDSDYDCRFIYRRRPERYLSLWQDRDVIETPLDNLYDVNGWDVAKALRLLVKGNAVAIEWLTSPIIYRTASEPKRLLTEFARKYANPVAIRSHYFHLAAGQLERHLSAQDRWQAKTLFYALRPASALRWLRLHPEQVLLPMNLWELMDGANVGSDIIAIARNFADIKSSAPEHQLVDANPHILAFVEQELSQAAPNVASQVEFEDARRAADEVFRILVDIPWSD